VGGHDPAMANAGAGRFRHFQEIVVVPAWRLGAYFVLELVGTVLTWRDLLISKSDQSKWRLDVLPHWDWGFWALGTSAVLLITLFEHSYRVRLKVEGEREAARADADGLKVRQVEASERQANEAKRANDANVLERRLSALASGSGVQSVPNDGRAASPVSLCKAWSKVDPIRLYDAASLWVDEDPSALYGHVLIGPAAAILKRLERAHVEGLITASSPIGTSVISGNRNRPDFWDVVSRRDLIALAELWGERPEFLFPED
jgi:hypothetical protein